VKRSAADASLWRYAIEKILGRLATHLAINSVRPGESSISMLSDNADLIGMRRDDTTGVTIVLSGQGQSEIRAHTASQQ